MLNKPLSLAAQFFTKLLSQTEGNLLFEKNTAGEMKKKNKGNNKA
ncbi:hypothetical protein [Virgibacillus kimchii]